MYERLIFCEILISYILENVIKKNPYYYSITIAVSERFVVAIIPI